MGRIAFGALEPALANIEPVCLDHILGLLISTIMRVSMTAKLILCDLARNGSSLKLTMLNDRAFDFN